MPDQACHSLGELTKYGSVLNSEVSGVFNCVHEVRTCSDEKFCIPSKKAFNLIQLKCPNGCSYIGSQLDMDEHQSYECEKRTVLCPNRDCKEKMEFKKLFEEHIMACDKLRIYCKSCFLPKAKADVKYHDCKERLARAIVGMIKPLVLVLYLGV